MNPLDVAPAQRGDRPAQARIFAAMIPTARYWARRMARHEAEDAQQTAMLSLFDSLRTYDAKWKRIARGLKDELVRRGVAA